MATEGNIESLSARYRGRDEAMRLHVVRNAWDGDCFGIYVRMKCSSGAEAVGLPLSLEVVKPEERFSNPISETPTISLRREEAQELMDELWRSGIRPADGTGSIGQLAATQAHLDDMRALVFKAGDPRSKPATRR